MDSIKYTEHWKRVKDGVVVWEYLSNGEIIPIEGEVCTARIKPQGERDSYCYWGIGRGK